MHRYVKAVMPSRSPASSTSPSSLSSRPFGNPTGQIAVFEHVLAASYAVELVASTRKSAFRVIAMIRAWFRRATRSFATDRAPAGSP